MKLLSRSRGIDAFPLTGGKWRDRLAPARTLSDLFEKRWMEGAVPLVLALSLSLLFVLFTPVGPADSPIIMDEVSEKGLLAIGLTVVLVCGGIDLSVGSMVGLTAIGAMVASRAWDWPMAVVAPPKARFSSQACGSGAISTHPAPMFWVSSRSTMGRGTSTKLIGSQSSPPMA